MNISERRLERLEASANSDPTHVQKQADFYRVCPFLFPKPPALKRVLDPGAAMLSFFVNALGIEQSGPLGSDPALRIGAVCLQRGLFERVHHCPGQSRAPGQDHARTVGVNVRLGRGLAFLSNDAPL